MSSETLKILDELTAILDLSDEFSYKELYEQARTYIFNKDYPAEGTVKYPPDTPQLPLDHPDWDNPPF